MVKSTRPIVRIHDLSTNEVIDREMNDDEFAENLVKWADVIRKTFAEGGIDEIISTRRLTHIIRAYSIFGDKMKAIELCLNRFDEETKQSFVQLYTKLDDTVTVSEQSVD